MILKAETWLKTAKQHVLVSAPGRFIWATLASTNHYINNHDILITSAGFFFPEQDTITLADETKILNIYILQNKP